MSKINNELFNSVSLHNMVWEKKELEKIINDKKNEVENNILENTIEVMENLILKGDVKKSDIASLLYHFMQRIKEVERTL